MTKKISRRSFMGHIGVVGAAAGGGMLLPDDSAQAMGGVPNPDPEHLKAKQGGWVVQPNGVDDLANIEFALKNTAPGGTVKLTKGVFKFGGAGSIADFDGVFTGSGRDKTILTTSDEYNYELWEAPGGGKDQGQHRPLPFPRRSVDGSPTKNAPGFLFFYKTPLNTGEDPADRANRIEIRDMACRGAAIGEPWALGDEVLCISVSNTIDWHNPGLPLETTRQDVLISRVDAAGYKTSEFGPFGNACACINVLGGLDLTDNYNLEGSVDGDALGLANGGIVGLRPAEGNVTMSDCRLANCRLGPAIAGYKNGTLIFENISTDGCRADCIRFLDNSNCKMIVRDCDLNCNSFTLPPEMAPGGISNQPSSLGCVLGIQGVQAVFGFPQNIQWLTLAFDPTRHPDPRTIGTWRAQGPSVAPQPSTLKIVDNSCVSTETPFTYCVHLIDGVNLAFGTPTLSVNIRRNDCNDSETCVSLEHVDDALVRNNDCNSQSFGVELHNSPNAQVINNEFNFTSGGAGCEVRMLNLGDKVGFSHVLPGAGSCWVQG